MICYLHKAIEFGLESLGLIKSVASLTHQGKLATGANVKQPHGALPTAISAETGFLCELHLLDATSVYCYI